MARLVRSGEAVRVTIVSHTIDPIRSIALAQLNMTGDMHHDLDAILRVDADDIFRDICKTELQGAFEFAHFNIQMEGVTRAFQQQLTRTRMASYSAESLRFTESGMEVLVGPGVGEIDGVDWRLEYEILMGNVEMIYRYMIEAGIPVEDARGILPLNVLSKIGMSVSYKTLVQMSRVRMCYQSQKGEWGPVFSMIVKELRVIDPLLTLPLGAFCEHGQECPFGSRLDRPCPRNHRKEGQ